MGVKYSVIRFFSATIVMGSFLLLLPSFVPGAMSVLAYYLSICVLATSIYMVKFGQIWCFKMTAFFVSLGTFFINDYLRLFESALSSTWATKMALYTLLIVSVLIGISRIKLKSRAHCKDV
ncbi:hypothetical protein S4054249_09790 [Pseudoalteromonas luteoviolacea]|uniref:Uncharacterized protein n=1 Tax=Pseudoalteromonas luteoviolacea S4054 TaxID=1129367 RepID=A0A0F6AGI4_9GAMM|nr:hypothetical protein S4054249_09790 [Pseudoalteromonas luteoviolacea]AOT13035.1 hypothetical protein S40542_09790 [Pseudoalteromonas luteoviolacea]AOT17947.1 hypothetical protein S4054_09785 [Pseudoalteromonas luteoviolacea]KKE84504.1 hypothetical protein N479_08760 [Pseudoalteromonas luteoviolacea S4054]KZN69522.1 hypothetical protein N481_22280 [Pseudoalteromonas luteoviolacea S4047-1]